MSATSLSRLLTNVGPPALVAGRGLLPTLSLVWTYRTHSTMFGVDMAPRAAGEHTSLHSAGAGAAGISASGSSVSELLGRAASLHDHLSDLHARFARSLAAQDMASAQEWQQAWKQQVHNVRALQKLVRTKGVSLGSAAALSDVERAAGQLAQRLL